MKISLLILFCNLFVMGFSQNTISFEQKAFDFYQDSLLVKDNIHKKIHISKSILDLSFDENHVGLYSVPFTCMKFTEIENQNNLDFILSDEYELDIDKINKNKFKIKNGKTKKYPMLRIYSPFYFTEDEETIYVNVLLKSSIFQEYYYTVAFDLNQNVKFWCKTNIIKNP